MAPPARRQLYVPKPHRRQQPAVDQEPQRLIGEQAAAHAALSAENAALKRQLDEMHDELKQTKKQRFIYDTVQEMHQACHGLVEALGPAVYNAAQLQKPLSSSLAALIKATSPGTPVRPGPRPPLPPPPPPTTPFTTRSSPYVGTPTAVRRTVSAPPALSGNIVSPAAPTPGAQVHTVARPSPEPSLASSAYTKGPHERLLASPDSPLLSPLLSHAQRTELTQDAEFVRNVNERVAVLEKLLYDLSEVQGHTPSAAARAIKRTQVQQMIEDLLNLRDHRSDSPMRTAQAVALHAKTGSRNAVDIFAVATGSAAYNKVLRILHAPKPPLQLPPAWEQHDIVLVMDNNQVRNPTYYSRKGHSTVCSKSSLLFSVFFALFSLYPIYTYNQRTPPTQPQTRFGPNTSRLLHKETNSPIPSRCSSGSIAVRLSSLIRVCNSRSALHLQQSSRQ